MALTAYCKKCGREVDAAEVCPYCGTRLGKNAAHAAWCVETVPAKDWIRWNSPSPEQSPRTRPRGDCSGEGLDPLERGDAAASAGGTGDPAAGPAD